MASGIWDRTSNGRDGRRCSAIAGALPTCRSTRRRHVRLTCRALPPTYIEAGSAEVFRDEGGRPRERHLGGGGSAELHIWAGGFHGFQTIVPTATLSRTAIQTRESWIRRVLSAPEQAIAR